MFAVTFQRPRELRYESVPDARIENPGDALVRVELTAVCGSDLHVWHGRERGLDAGTVMGHEFIGTVVEVGSAVSTLRRDARVLSPFTTSCGSCFYCRAGLTSRCESGQLFGWVEQGAGLHGGQAELVRVPLADSTLIEIPEDVGPEEALLLGDVLSTGFYCARQAGVGPEGVYVVVGCGPVGLAAIVGARELGARRLLAIDSVAERLERARAFGAEPIDFTARSAAAVVREATDGRGADAVLEVVGTPAAHRAAIDLVRPGGTVSVVGVHNEERFPFSPAEAYDRNLTYRVGRCPARHLATELIPLARSGRYDLSSIFSHRLPLEHGPEAYRMFDAKRDGCLKVALVPPNPP